MPLSVLKSTYALRLTRTAVDNARSAYELLAQSLADRRDLAPAANGELVALNEADCLRLLANHTVGRLAYVARAGTADIAPVNYVLYGRDVLVRSGPGPKLQAAERGEQVAFEVDDIDEQTRTGWSVVVAGRAERVPVRELAALPLPEPWSPGPRRHLLRVRASRITGRSIGDPRPSDRAASSLPDS